MTDLIVGVSLRPWRRPGKADRWMQSMSYFSAVEAAGGIPLGIAPTGAAGLRALYDLCGALVLPGGMDIAPELYGRQRRTVTEIQPELDAMELTLVRWAAEDRKPLLGICRGQQLLNVALGGTLWQDLAERPGTGAHGGDDGTEFHEVAVAEGSALRAVAGASGIVNSRHHQAVDRPGRGLTAVAHAPDGVVEAVEAAGPWFALCVQWHPEELPAEAPLGGGLFRALTAAGLTAAGLSRAGQSWAEPDLTAPDLTAPDLVTPPDRAAPPVGPPPGGAVPAPRPASPPASLRTVQH
jgi:putative glutamine amidotransferase